jgi:serine/threonine-protein kinase
MRSANDRWAEVAAQFDRLVELEAVERESALAALATGDPELAADVRSLLRADETDNPLLGSEAAAVVPGILAELGTAPANGMIGPYRLLRAIGEGGMGEVWLAERSDGSYEQQVAIKLLKRGMDTRAILRRFMQERRILARLHHPQIVRLIDGGMSEDGRPYYAMDFVDGLPITRHAAAQALSVGARVALLIEVADAVAYAHTQLVVHRDLKPSNVLVDGEGRPRVLDFGIAKLIEESGEETRTGTGQRVLSPAYAAPEQILGEAIGTPADVYALGLMLCELLTGQLPRRRVGTTPALLAMEASRETVDRASALAAQAAPAELHQIYGDLLDRRELARTLAGDLDLIIATALHRDPARRYTGAAAFAEDLRRWRDRRPIAARADSGAYRLRQFVRRHRLGVAATGLIALSLIGGLGAALRQTGIARAEAQRADLERSNAQRQLERSERVKEFILTLFREQDPISRAGAQARSPTQLIRDGIAALDSSLSGEPELQAQLLRDLGEIQTSLDDRQAAQATLERAWRQQSQLSGARSVASAETLAVLAEAVYVVGDVARSERLLRDALAILREAGLGDSPRAARAESLLATVDLVAGRNDQAERLSRHSVEVFRTTFGPDHPEVAMRLGEYGKIRQEQGDYAEALASYREALDIVARSNGGEHVRSAKLHLNVGDVMRLQRRYPEAMQHYQSALAAVRKALPADHAYLGSILLRVGDLQRRTGDLAAADRSFVESLAILSKTPSGQYAQALQTYGNLARAEGRFELAAQRFHQAFEVFRSTTGDSVYTWLTALLEVSVLIESGKLAQADALATEATRTLARITPDDAYNRTYAASVMGKLRQTQGRNDEAVPLLRKALAGLETLYDKDHAEIASARIALASSLLGEETAASREESAVLIDAAIASLSRAGDAGSEPMLGAAYLERSRLHWQNDEPLAAREDIDAAIARLQSAEFANTLRQALSLARRYAATAAR